ncbi:MAG: ATP-dependent zinc metalloprotease FtsH [Candidatus Peribacteraceae bacterium]|nr:ATP-dependent zinc metalloprotease FtsH [Candidatus Peribacteraceae bacterium]
MPPRPQPPRNRQQWLLSAALIAGLLVLSVLYVVNPTGLLEDDFANAVEVPISQVTLGYEQGAFKRIVVRDNTVYAVSHTGAVVSSYKETLDTVSQLGWNDPKNTTVVEVENREATNMLLQVLPDILMLVLVIVGILWIFRGISRSQNNAMSFGKSKARIADAKQVRTRFKDVAGAAEAKEELVEVVDFLKNPKKYLDLGAKIPKGVLLVGPPGTGKTLMARAVAGEAGVPFFSIAGSEFVEMFVGVGASRVRDLFVRAKRNSPCIIFIDEIDAVGRQRGGAGFGGGHDEREQTLNQILTEMDGFEQGTNVIVMAATNRPDVLDAALLRPGRFDRHVFLDKPDLEAREQILKVHCRGKKVARGVSLRPIARQSVGMTGADLENVMNEAAIFAAKRGRSSLNQQDIVDALEKITIGAERRSRKLTQKEKEITAYHELGHAVVGHLCPESDPLHKISVVSRGQALGVTWFLPKEDNYTTSRSKFLDEICGLLGGRAAEEIIFKEITTGASNDLERASAIARNMATRYGMGGESLGTVAYGERQGTASLGVELGQSRNYSENVAVRIDAFVQQTLEEQYERAKGFVRKHKAKIDELAELLLKKENLTVEEFLEVFEGKKKASEIKVPNEEDEPTDFEEEDEKA